MEPLGPRVRVRAALPLQDFKVLLTFDNGVQREVDLEPYLRGPIFEAMRSDPDRFRSMTIAGGTLTWDNGADIDPDVLYYHLKPAWLEEAETVRA